MAIAKKTPHPSAGEGDYNITSRFKPSVDLTPVNGFKLGIYGRAKVGKTHFALTAPKPIYVIDTEDSVRTNVRQFPEDVQREVFVSEVLQYADKKAGRIDLVKSLHGLLSDIDYLTGVIVSSEQKGTIVVDSATDVWTWLGIWLEEQTDLKRSQSGKMIQTEWGKANKKYTDFMYLLKKSNWNVIFTFRAHEAVGKAGEHLGYDVPQWQKSTDFWLDLVGEMTYDGTSTKFRFDKDRFGRIVGEVENPSWDSVVKYIHEKAGVKIV